MQLVPPRLAGFKGSVQLLLFLGRFGDFNVYLGWKIYTMIGRVLFEL